MTILAISILLLSSFFDALRDTTRGRAGWHRPESCLPWPLVDRWHVVKRLAFYPPLAFLWWVHVPGWWKALLVLAAWAAWRAGCRAGGKDWKSTWMPWRWL